MKQRLEIDVDENDIFLLGASFGALMRSIADEPKSDLKDRRVEKIGVLVDKIMKGWKETP